MACHDARVRRVFRGQVLCVTLGRDLTGTDAVRQRVNDLVEVLGGEPTAAADLQGLGIRLGQAMGRLGRALLVIDDVWSQDPIPLS
jgi:hypothetical protein